VAVGATATSSTVRRGRSPSFEVRTPRFRAPNYRTSGTYPQVASDSIEVGAVNVSLRRAIREDQRRYAAFVKQFEKIDPSVFRKTSLDPGYYQTYPSRRLMSASSVVVSALIPATEQTPGGTDSGRWISATVAVPSGRSTRITQLFSRPSEGLARLAAAARRRLVARDSCVRGSLRNEQALGMTFVERGFAPLPKNYAHFALTVGGVAIGFENDQVGGGSCGAPEVTVPYGLLRAQFSKLGEQLVAGVRPPTPRATIVRSQPTALHVYRPF
jgi:hypothetical protein